jgi:hypothetical protein
MRRGLSILAVMVFLIIVGIAVLVGYYTAGPGKTTTTTTGKSDLSFKPFTLNELLHNKLQVDIATCGTTIHSAKFQQIEQRTSQIRGLPLKKEVPLVSTTESTLEYKLIYEFNKQTKEEQQKSAGAEKILKAMGLLKPTDSLEDIEVRVLTEQIAGTYDPETKKITVIAGKGVNTTSDEVTLSHEVTHALQDQNFGLTKPPLDVKTYNGDNQSAIDSLVEGDATDTMIVYARTYISAADLLQMQQESSNVSSKELDRAPLYIRESLLFPYQQGLTFTQAIKDKGGGEQGVDHALAAPPLSTEQVLHPDLYLDGRHNPRPVTLPDLTTVLGKGWKNLDTDALGEFDIQVWFQEFAGHAKSREASDGWAGNTIQYYQGPGKNYVMPTMTVWDTDLDAQEFFDDYVDLLQGRLKSGLKKVGSTATSYMYQAGGVFFYCGMTGDSTLALQSPDRGNLETALKSYPQMASVPLPGI